ncbi:MAG: hypothetical protein IT204_14140 [Fimbriimonadaceae bacterium]|nr:hypothetical protein [Fimbriimonadaceae bacterium]
MPRRPNVLWILTDEQRTDSLGCSGAPWAVSPQLDDPAAAPRVGELLAAWQERQAELRSRPDPRWAGAAER